MNAASVVVTCEVVGTLNHYKMVKKNFDFDIKTSVSASARARASASARARASARGGGDIMIWWEWASQMTA